MKTATDTVRQYNRACESKDAQALRGLLDKNYRFKGPMMEAKSAEEMIELMAQCPFVCTTENLQSIAEGNRVAQVFDWVTTTPFNARVTMCEILEVENGKVKSSQLFYDTAAFPKEAQEIMRQTAKQAA